MSVPFQYPRKLVDHDFGLGLTPQDHLTLLCECMRVGDKRNIQRDFVSSSEERMNNFQGYYDVQHFSSIKEKFQINLDVHHFAPEEISVKTIDGFLVIEAKHEERKDVHGYISRSFTRRYELPDGIEVNSVVSRLSSNGVLSVRALLKAPPKDSNERIVPIQQTGPVKKQNEHDDIKEEEEK